ncbi:hypothetical protein [Alkalisalibacterium limincola]|uniref:Uncharacterized protein n=1 Tax=Alkalisalibacterium limincola TaxID=2699169 RepID=A0A5C8KPG9_9GAMM|nr:hypothetical protein [Alkalisalibacterium limincola]TXK62032.1 hypothetical protein FU658_09250 [Alkalisalibacterium limincola]
MSQLVSNCGRIQVSHSVNAALTGSLSSITSRNCRPLSLLIVVGAARHRQRPGRVFGLDLGGFGTPGEEAVVDGHDPVAIAITARHAGAGQFTQACAGTLDRFVPQAGLAPRRLFQSGAIQRGRGLQLGIEGCPGAVARPAGAGLGTGHRQENEEQQQSTHRQAPAGGATR